MGLTTNQPILHTRRRYYQNTYKLLIAANAKLIIKTIFLALGFEKRKVWLHNDSSSLYHCYHCWKSCPSLQRRWQGSTSVAGSCGFSPLIDCPCHGCGSREGWDICLCRKWLRAFGMIEPRHDLVRSRFTTRAKKTSSHFALESCN